VGVAAGVDHIETITSECEEASGAPATPRAVADVDRHLLLVHHHVL